MSAQILSAAAFAVAALAVYGGALLDADHRLSTAPWVVALFAATVHLVLEVRRPRAHLPGWGQVAYGIAWLGWLAPMAALRPLWALAIASLVASVALARTKGAEHGALHATPARPEVPAVVASGGRLRAAVVVAWVVVLGVATALGFGGQAAASSGLYLVAISVLIERPVGWRRAVLVATTVIGSVLMLGLALLSAAAMASASAGRWRAIAVAVAGVVVLGLAGRAPAVAGRTLPHRAAWWLCATAGLAAAIIVAASSQAPLSLVDPAQPGELERGPTGLVIALVVLELLGAVVLVGARSRRDLAAAAARLDLRWPRPIVLVGCVAAFGGLAASFGLWGESLMSALGPPPRDVSEVLRLAVGVLSVGAVLELILAALWEEVLFRGVLMPRVGLAVSSAAFAALHALQYGAFDLWIGLALGLAFGVIAARWGTVAAALGHVSWNLVTAYVAAG
jgi:membrane protease YdiL (CAAX protease family)